MARWTRPAGATAAAAMAGLLLAGVAHAGGPVDPNHPELSPRLAELATPKLRNASRADQAEAVDLPASGPMSIPRAGGDLIVEIRFEHGAARAVPALEAAGARMQHVSRRYQVVTAAVDPADLRAVADVPGVASVLEALTPQVGGHMGPPALDDDFETGVACPNGDATSEGDAQLRADDLRSALGLDGTGVKVGVLSDSFDIAVTSDASDDIASGDLPGPGNPCGHTTPVDLIEEGPSGADEGRAMLQIVHDLAPGADLAYATGTTGIFQFAANVRDLRAAGADVIADDITYFRDPMYQPGPIDVAIDDVTSQGTTYFSLAANNNIVSGVNDVASWEAPAFRSSSTCPASLSAETRPPSACMDFDPDDPGDDQLYGITASGGNFVRMSLQWAEPWNGVETDLDLYVLDNSLNVVARATDANLTTQQPVEVVTFNNTDSAPADFHVAIGRNTGTGGGGTANPRLKLTFIRNGGQGTFPNEYTTSEDGDVVGPAIFGHNGAGNAITVGAVPFSDSTVVEPYSSRGPVTHYFGPVTGTTPAAPLSAPEVLAKPDVAATDGGLTTFFGPSNRFFGTSASTPHAGAVAALQLQADPSLTPAQIRSLQLASGRPVGTFTQPAAGSGLIDAIVATPPPRVAVSAPALGNNRSPAIAFSANRAASFACSLDGAPAQACTSPLTPPALGDGSHSLAVAATDALGHQGTGSATFAIDATAPVATITAGVEGPTRESQPTFSFSADDPGAALQCRFDAAGFAPCSAASTHAPAAPLPDGPHTFSVQAVDAATNASPPAERSFDVDTRKPKVSFRKRPPKRTRNRRARFTARSDESGVSFACKLDGARFRACGKRKTVRVKRGRHKFTVRATDAAGNAGKKAFRWRVIR
jgi:hypothetical protein